MRLKHKFPKKLACMSMYCHILIRFNQAETALIKTDKDNVGAINISLWQAITKANAQLQYFGGKITAESNNTPIQAHFRIALR